jgi:hypothetical protein
VSPDAAYQEIGVVSSGSARDQAARVRVPCPCRKPHPRRSCHALVLVKDGRRELQSPARKSSSPARRRSTVPGFVANSHGKPRRLRKCRHAASADRPKRGSPKLSPRLIAAELAPNGRAPGRPTPMSGRFRRRQLRWPARPRRPRPRPRSVMSWAGLSG